MYARVGVRTPGMVGTLWPPWTLQPPSAEGVWVPLLRPTAIQSGAYTAQADDLVLVSLAGGDVTISAPAPASARLFAIKVIGTAPAGNTVTVSATGAQVDGAALDELATTGESAIYVCGPGDGAAWSWWRVA